MGNQDKQLNTDIYDSVKEKNPSESVQKSVLAYIHDFVWLLAGVLLAFSLCFRMVVVSGPSMNNTLMDGDWLLLLGNVFYTDPEYGDIVVASKDSFKNGEPIIKRVIATEGQIVDIDFENGIVYVDGLPLEVHLERRTLVRALLEKYLQKP